MAPGIIPVARQVVMRSAGSPRPSPEPVNPDNVPLIEWRGVAAWHTPPAVQVIVDRSRHLLSGRNGRLDHLSQRRGRRLVAAAPSRAEAGVRSRRGERTGAAGALAGQVVAGEHWAASWSDKWPYVVR